MPNVVRWRVRMACLLSHPYELARREWANSVGYGLTVDVPGVGDEAKRDPNGSFLRVRKGDWLCSLISGLPNEEQRHFDIAVQLCAKALGAT